MSVITSFARITAFSTVVAIASGALAADPPPDPAATGTDLGRQIESTWCPDPEAFSTKLIKPLMSPSQLATLDGSKQGNAQIACPGSDAIFEVLIQPGPSKDLSFLQVSYDSNLDGSFDGSYSTTSPISGVCSNGVVSCQPGTWNGCRFYKWQYSSGLTLTEVLSRELSGCYCFNTGCSSAPFTAMQRQVLESLGGGVAGAMAAANPRLAAVQAEVGGYTIKYFGQSMGDCTVESGDLAAMGVPDPENIYLGAASLTTAASAELSAQAADPNSLYYLVTHSPAYQNTTRDQCSITRTVTLEYWCNGTPTAGSAQATGACGAPAAQWPTVGFNWQVTYKLANQTTNTLTGSKTRTLCTDHLLFTRARMAPDGKTVFIEYAGTDPSGTVIGWNCGGEYNNWIIIDQVNLPEGVMEWEAKIDITYSGGGCDTGHAVATAYWCFQGQNLKEDIVDQCLALADDPKCRLEKEINKDASGVGVYTVFDFSPTGVVPTNTCKSLTGPYGTETACRPWWQIDRTYVCDAYPIDIDTSRQEMVDATLSGGGNSWTYTDVRTDQGVSITETGNVDLAVNLNPEDCVKVCKLRQADRSALSTGPATTADYQRAPEGSVDIYRVCTNGGNTCDVRSGEVLVRDCSCINEFNLAYGVMETARQGGIDITCSSGAPQNFAF